jgi:hypothetical protein
LAQRHGAQSIYTVPLVKSGKPVGAHARAQPHRSPAGGHSVKNIAALYRCCHQRAVDRVWPMKICRHCGSRCASCQEQPRKLTAVSWSSAGTISADYRVNAPARLKARYSVLVASADGYLKNAQYDPATS